MWYIGLHKLADVIFGTTVKPLYITSLHTSPIKNFLEHVL